VRVVAALSLALLAVSCGEPTKGDDSASQTNGINPKAAVALEFPCDFADETDALAAGIDLPFVAGWVAFDSTTPDPMEDLGLRKIEVRCQWARI
jgi:hypothetical protein